MDPVDGSTARPIAPRLQPGPTTVAAADARARTQALGLLTAGGCAIALAVWLGVPGAAPFDAIGVALLSAWAGLGFLLFAIARGGRLDEIQLVRIGLFFQTIGALILATRTLLAFQDHTARGLEWSTDGPTLVTVWVLVVTVLVQPTWRWAIVTGLVSVAWTPSLLLAHQHLAPTLEPTPWPMAMASLPDLAAALLCVVPAVILRRARQRIHDAGGRDRQRLDRPIGQCGPREIWTGVHPRLARPVWIEVVRADRLGGDDEVAGIVLADFEAAARRAVDLQSPHAVEVYAVERVDASTLHVVTEALEGIDLRSLVERFGPLPSERVVYALGQVCHALHDAHARGIVHGDLDPANVLLCAKGIELDFVKVRGFGTAPPLVDPASTGDPAAVPRGSAECVAPEQADGRTPDARSDVYAVGCLAYWMLTGAPVFGGNPAAMIAQHMRDVPLAPAERTARAIDPELDAIVRQCLDKEPDRRPTSARHLGQLLAATGSVGAWTEERCREWWERLATGQESEADDGPALEPETEAEARPEVRTPSDEPDFFRRRAARRQTSDPD